VDLRLEQGQGLQEEFVRLRAVCAAGCSRIGLQLWLGFPERGGQTAGRGGEAGRSEACRSWC